MSLTFKLPVACLLLCAACAAPVTPNPSTFAAEGAASFDRHGGPQYLYAVDFLSGDVGGYALPLQSNEPLAAKTAVKAAGLAAFGPYLFASTAHGAQISEMKLPLVNGEKPLVSISAPNGNAIAAGIGFIYISTQGMPGSVAAYATPLKRGERASVTIANGVDFPAALAVDSTHLYVANQDTTLTAYPLPLRNGEAPDATLSNLHDESGIAVSGNTLYLSRFDTAQIFAYRLPLHTGEKPSVTLNTGFNWTGTLAATSTDLYVSDVQRSAWDFALPLHAGEHSSAYVQAYPANGNLLAVPFQ